MQPGTIQRVAPLSPAPPSKVIPPRRGVTLPVTISTDHPFQPDPCRPVQRQDTTAGRYASRRVRLRQPRCPHPVVAWVPRKRGQTRVNKMNATPPCEPGQRQPHWGRSSHPRRRHPDRGLGRQRGRIARRPPFRSHPIKSGNLRFGDTGPGETRRSPLHLFKGGDPSNGDNATCKATSLCLGTD